MSAPGGYEFEIYRVFVAHRKRNGTYRWGRAWRARVSHRRLKIRVCVRDMRGKIQQFPSRRQMQTYIQYAYVGKQ